ncbi:carboxymuconolactone decarboxylase family protein [Sphingopyxis solisilvae]|uniref:carboxymuconolactone decarboxylase family protein n=1 Tax=Sphingopyxis solisilvae TaxID=1886788 RepID=UPI001892A2EC|nr:carboxymuconolactone decarboxylase family protein [Sphingopyxis solisilvae]
MTDPYRAGIDILAQTGTTQDARRNRAAEVAPDFIRTAVSFAYGEIFARPGLDLKTRELAAVAVFAALGRSNKQLRQHVQAALHLGWSRDQITEILIQTAAHAGVAAAIDALAECHDLLAESVPTPDCC